MPTDDQEETFHIAFTSPLYSCSLTNVGAVFFLVLELLVVRYHDAFSSRTLGWRHGALGIFLFREHESISSGTKESRVLYGAWHHFFDRTVMGAV